MNRKQKKKPGQEPSLKQKRFPGYHNDPTILELYENESLDDTDELINPADEFTVTEEDLAALGPMNLSMDGGSDEQLKDRTIRVDLAEEDLDLQGTALDNGVEDVGSENENNNNYRLGGDDRNELEESQPQ